MSDLALALVCFVALVIVGRLAWRDASLADRREAEDDALRKYGPMD